MDTPGDDASAVDAAGYDPTDPAPGHRDHPRADRPHPVDPEPVLVGADDAVRYPDLFAGLTIAQKWNVHNNIASHVLDGWAPNRDDIADLTALERGDIDGDGLADLLVGAPTASGQPGGGGAYVIYGSTSGAFAHSAFTQTGGVGDDVMSDAGQPAVIAGGAGDDTLSLSRGGSIGLGGAGDDTLVIGIDFLLEGLAGAVNGRISHLDGGSGVDTLKIVGSGIVLDLTALQNPGIGLEHGAGRLSGIERVDLTGSGDNRLKISIEDIIDLSSANVFNAGNGWTGLAATVHDHQMVINGNAGDRVELASQLGWSSGGDATLDGVMYHIVRNASAGTALYIQDGVTGPLTI